MGSMISKKLFGQLVAVAAAWIVLSAAFAMLIPDILWPFGLMLSAFVIFVVVLSFRFRLFVPLEGERFSVQDIAHRFREKGYLVEERPGKTWIAIDRLTRIAIFSRASRQKKVLCYKVDPTPLGWSVLVVCLLIYLLAPIEIAVIFVHGLKDGHVC